MGTTFRRCLSLALFLAAFGLPVFAADYSVTTVRLTSMRDGHAYMSANLVGPWSEAPVAAYWVDGPIRASYLRWVVVVTNDYSTFPPREVISRRPVLDLPVASRVVRFVRSYSPRPGMYNGFTLPMPADPTRGHFVFVALDRNLADDENPANNTATFSLNGPELAFDGRPVIEQIVGVRQGFPNRRLHNTIVNSGFRNARGAQLEITIVERGEQEGLAVRQQFVVALPELAPGRSHEVVTPYTYRGYSDDGSVNSFRARILLNGDIIPSNNSRSLRLQ